MLQLSFHFLIGPCLNKVNGTDKALHITKVLTVLKIDRHGFII